MSLAQNFAVGISILLEQILCLNFFLFNMSSLVPSVLCFFSYLLLCLWGVFFTSLLEYNCFTMVCWFLLYNKVNQLYVYIYPHIPSLLRLPPTLPIPPL